MQPAHCPKPFQSPPPAGSLSGSPPSLWSAQLTFSHGSRRRATSHLPFTERGMGTARPEGEEMRPGRCEQLTSKPHTERQAPFLQQKASLYCPAGTHRLCGLQHSGPPSLLICEPWALHKTASEPTDRFPEFWGPSLPCTLLRSGAKARRKTTRSPAPVSGPPGGKFCETSFWDKGGLPGASASSAPPPWWGCHPALPPTGHSCPLLSTTALAPPFA